MIGPRIGNVKNDDAALIERLKSAQQRLLRRHKWRCRVAMGVVAGKFLTRSGRRANSQSPHFCLI
jgi:hypothetical protein